MMDFYKKNIPIIGDQPDAMDLAFPSRSGLGSWKVGFGLIPRDYKIQPEEMFQSPSEMELIDESEWDARFEEEEKEQSSLEHLYLRGGEPAFINLDQNGDGHCWAYSTGSAMMLDRLKQGLPLVRLNPHATAAILRQLSGGWCGLSAKFSREHGYAVQGDGPGEWPLHSNNTNNDTPALRASMALHKVTEDWVDLTRDVYDQNLSAKMAATCLFNKIPCPSDYGWWGHSVCRVRKVRIEKGRWGDLILNSWKGWGRFGLGVLEGSKTNTMGSLAIRVSGSSAT